MPQLNIEQLAKKLGKASCNGSGWVCLCPAHDDRNPSLSLSWDSTTQKLLVKCHAGCDYDDIMAAIRQKGYQLLKNSETLTQQSASAYTSNTERARHIWQQTESADGTVVETYLQSRGYTGVIPPSIQYHPSLYHAPSKTYYPAMVARIEMWPSSDLYAIHRTYLSKDGLEKAPVEPNKMMLGHAKGGAVRLTPPGQTLIITEGIETALSVYQSIQLPTWAALSTTGMQHIVVPSLDITREIIVAADGDEPGLNTAKKLAKRLVNQGYIVRIAPAPEGRDFNDVLRGAE
jgi:putative DNA primase/helicase